VKNKVSEQL